MDNNIIIVEIFLFILYRHLLDVDLSGLENVVRARKRKKLPIVLTPSEINKIFDQLDPLPMCAIRTPCRGGQTGTLVAMEFYE